jgi:hypothetical protein
LRASSCCEICLKLVTWACASLKLVRVQWPPSGVPLWIEDFPLVWKARGEYNGVLLASWSALCLHTAPIESSTRKYVNFGIHRRLCVPRLLPNPSSFTYAPYIMIAFMLDVLYIDCYHLVVYLA